MKGFIENFRAKFRNRDRGPFWGSLLVLLGIVVAAVFILWSETDTFSKGDSPHRLTDQPVTEVRRGPLSINVTESGTINPREQLILKNETDLAVAIVSVVPEGKLVEKGELLVELDSTQLENQVVERRLAVLNDKADLVAAQENLAVVKNKGEADVDQAELDFKFAKQDLKKYKEGEYPNLIDEANARIALAKSQLRQAEEELQWSEILSKEKYLSKSELQQDQLNHQKAQLDLKLAEADLALLKEYTYSRQIDQLESDVKQAEMALERAKRTASANLAQAEADLTMEESRLVEEKGRLARDERRLDKTKIYAPISGRVLYATSVGNRWRRNDDPIEVGTQVDQRDEIIYLPTASEYNAEVQITEVELDKVRVDLPARVTVDAIPNKVLTGKVSRIAQYPDADSRYLNPNLKLYETVIELDAGQANLRNGMSCQVEIQVEHLDDALHVPVQSVTRRNGSPVVYVVDSEDIIHPREVEIGLDNARFVHVRDGLKEGERILLAPPLDSSSPTEREEGESASNHPDNPRQSVPIESREGSATGGSLDS